MLGIAAADPAALSQYQLRTDAPKSYIDALGRLAEGNFGRTLDGVSVNWALGIAIEGSAPLFLVSFSLILATMILALIKPRPLAGPGTAHALAFVAFVPAYLPGFLLLALSVIATTSLVFVDSWSRELALGFIAGIGPACLAASVILGAYDAELREPYVLVMRGYGYDEGRIFRSVRRAALLYSIPSWEKLLSLQIVVLIFTEAIFSYPGFGSMFLLAVQRTDTNLILAAVIYLSAAVAIARAVGTFALRMLDPREREQL